VAFLLVNADSLVPAVLGEQWRASVPIFIWLGCAALHQPLSATTGWLFVSQSRTGEFAKWGVVVAVTSIAAFLIGLPWGALGVAAAYGLSDLLLRAPIVWIWVGRKGPVSTRDLIRVAWPNAVAVAGVLLSQWGLHRLPMSSSIYVDLAVRAVLAYAVAWGVIALIPGGREAFRDLFQTLSVLRKPVR
jgi:PST family polysaccharide transporter